ncbi:MAG TPA: hypothetical protein V6D03_13020, partial [Candidatus Caenarcaniphilales bacterium]
VEVIEKISSLRHEYITAMGSVESLARKIKAVFPVISKGDDYRRKQNRYSKSHPNPTQHLFVSD